MEEEEEDQLIQNTNICCNICGECNFNVREGFYYCLECGTKQEQVRDIEVDQDDMFHEGPHVTKHTIKKTAKDENGELTSWECYNYILRGMVEELLNLGAKEALKLTAFQVWTAILRRNEVAFFSKKAAQLPRLSVRYFSRDARTIYNHRLNKIKRRRRIKTVVDADDQRQAKRVFRKSKKKLDEAAYSVVSNETNETNYSVASVSNSGATSQKSTGSMKLAYSTAARKTFKKFIPLKHLAKHATDESGSLKCHKLRWNSRKTPKFLNVTSTMSIKQVYGIIAIALNLIGDDIQLCDLVRFISEEHISIRNVLDFFPENIRSSGAKLLKEIQFNVFPDKYGTHTLREHICTLSRLIPMNGFEMPNLFELSRRYVEDLNLPTDFADYIERFMNVLPPAMKTRTPHQYPHYEARAMAYILFTAKLLFGLDGEKERAISKSATEINKEMRNINDTKQTEINHAQLFVWADWVKYVEMRKVILARYNSTYCRQFNEFLTTDQVVHEMAEKERRQNESENNHRQSHNKMLNKVQENIRHIFEGLLSEKLDKDAENSAPYIQFQPSLKPSHHYFKRVLLLEESGAKMHIPIPEMMHVDHTKHTLMPFLDATELSSCMAKYGCEVKVEDLACTANRTNMGIFHYDRSATQYPDTKVFKANTNISKEEWLEEIKRKSLSKELVFKTEFEHYNHMYQRKLDKDMEKKRAHMNQSFNALSSMVRKMKIEKSIDAADESILKANFKTLRSTATSEVFEDDMKPLEIDLYAPRNFLKIQEEEENEEVTDDYVDDDVHGDVDGDVNDDDGEDNNRNIEMETIMKGLSGMKEITLCRSNFDYWSLIGYIGPINSESKKDLFSVFPPSFSWLMELCAQMINVDWIEVYEQLLVLELMFIHGIENIEDIDKCLHYKYNNSIKDINFLTKYYRDLW